MNIFLDTEFAAGQSIGQVITMMFRVSDKVRADNGWLEPAGQTLQREEFPTLYEHILNCPDAAIKSLIINEDSFRLPDWRATHLRQYGTNGIWNAGGVGTKKNDAIKTHTHNYDRAYGNNDRSGSNSNNYHVRILNYAQIATTPPPQAESENRVYTHAVVYYIKAK